MQDSKGTIGYRYPRESVPGITEVVWIADAVNVFVCNPPGGNVLVTFDRRHRTVAPSSDRVKATIRASLTARYNLDQETLEDHYKGDALTWACTGDGGGRLLFAKVTGMAFVQSRIDRFVSVPLWLKVLSPPHDGGNIKKKERLF